MRVVYSIPTRIGASGLGGNSFEALKGIYARGYLERVVAYGNRQQEIPARYIRPMRFYAAKIFSNLPARYYYPAKMKSLDRLTVRVLRKGADLFHGWSGSSLRSLRYCRERGIVSFMENPAPHFRYTEEIMNREYDELGIRWKKDPEVFARFFGFGPDYLQEEYDSAQYLILESDFTRDTFRTNGIGEEKLLVVPSGVDTNRFVPPPRREAGPFRAIFVGAIGVRKGVRYLLEAWKNLKLASAELLLVGIVQDDMRPVLERYVKSDPSIRMAGFVGDLVRLYQDASVFIFPSLSEGSAKVTYEAMACGLPMIVTPNAGSVVRDGEDGYIVPVRDNALLGEKILRLYENPGLREEMGRRARNHIESYTWDAHRKLLIETYEKAYSDAHSG
ncbi:MAG TPA: glycosyltransferase family 4 protein [Candidatus Deferrimicrobiaceae bacterium]|nr:glycosyltransferase family 4 protein [Candidatus Deferrimicrobiaceae bacterium]